MLADLSGHTQLETSHSFICLQMQSMGFEGVRDTNQQQNYSSLVHLLTEQLVSSSMNQELVLYPLLQQEQAQATTDNT